MNEFREIKAYVKVGARWLIDTAKALINVAESSSLVDVEIKGGKFAMSIFSPPSSFSREIEVNSVIGNCKEFFISVSANTFLATLSKLPSPPKKEADSVFVGLRVADGVIFVTMFGAGKRSDINYSFVLFDKGGGVSRVGSAGLEFVVNSWAICGAMKKIKSVKDSGRGISSVSGFELVVDKPEMGTVTIYGYTNNVSIRAVVLLDRGPIVLDWKTASVGLDLCAAQDMATAMNGLKINEDVKVSLSHSWLKVESSEVCFITQGKVDRRAGQIARVFEGAEKKVKAGVVVDAEKIKGVLERLDVLAKANPDNTHKVGFSIGLGDVSEEQKKQGKVVPVFIKLSSRGHGVGAGEEIVPALILENDSRTETKGYPRQGGDVGNLRFPIFEQVYFNATKFGDILRSSNYSNEIEIWWGETVMLFRWFEEVDVKKVKEEEGKGVKPVEYTALLALIKA